MGMKIRKGWLIIWPDGTEWRGDCPEWAAAVATPGSVLRAIRILGNGRWPCTACALGLRH